MRVVSGARQVLFSTVEKNAVTSIEVIGCEGIVKLAFHKNALASAIEKGQFEVILRPFKPSLEGLTFEDKETQITLDLKEFAEIKHNPEKEELHVVFNAMGTEILNGGGHVVFVDFFR